MPTTYVLRDTNSGLAVPINGRFYKELLTTTGTAGTVTSGAIAGGLTVDGYAFTDVGDPGAAGLGVSFTVEMNVTVSSTTCNIQAMVARVNSAGANVTQGGFATAQAATTGLHTFTCTMPAGAWAAGDRLRVTYRYVRTSTMGSETVTITANTTVARVIAPWTLPTTGTLAKTQDPHTLAASGTFTSAGSTGTLAATQAGQTLAASGVLRYTGTLGVSQAAQTLSAAGTSTPPSVTGTLAATQAAQTLAASGGPQQFARPVADRLVGGWTTDTGATSNLYQAVDEAAASFADFIRSENNPATSPVVLRLGALAEPVGAVGDGAVQLRVQYDKEGADTAALVVQLRQGYTNEGSPGTLIAATSDSNVTDAAEDITLALTAVEAAAITYTGGAASNLDVRITADVT